MKHAFDSLFTIESVERLDEPADFRGLAIRLGTLRILGMDKRGERSVAAAIDHALDYTCSRKGRGAWCVRLLMDVDIDTARSKAVSLVFRFDDAFPQKHPGAEVFRIERKATGTGGIESAVDSAINEAVFRAVFAKTGRLDSSHASLRAREVLGAC